jgi:hypothetical protein
VAWTSHGVRVEWQVSDGRPCDAIVRAQLPVRLDHFNEPEPDLTLLRRRPDFYASAHPGPAEILLVVEVAESSIRSPPP